MNRREFILRSGLISLPILLTGCAWKSRSLNYKVIVDSDYTIGHSMLKGLPEYEIEHAIRDTEVAIIGGGIAGLVAANAVKLKGFKPLVLELSASLGGTSSSKNYGEVYFSQGAHYELAYPDYYGESTLKFLEQSGLIYFQPWTKQWSFKERKHIITGNRKGRSFYKGMYSEELFPPSQQKNKFIELMASYEGMMPMPTPKIDSSLHYLNELSFYTFLNDEIGVSEEMKIALDYQMKDDYGAGMEQVSALAGIHYYACRPYYRKVVELFSPPEGNSYFVNHFNSKLKEEERKTSQMVISMEENARGVLLGVLDYPNKRRYQIQANKAIYAANKHTLRHIHPDHSKLFKHQQAPWMVVNIIIRNELNDLGFWQNEMVVDDTTFMGFIDSDSQTERSNIRVFTAYYCLPAESRKDLINVESNAAIIADQTISYISEYFHTDIESLVLEVQIKVMGHAMPIPEVGYLFNDANRLIPNSNIRYAGVDNGRLPLFFEAVDSALSAVESL